MATEVLGESVDAGAGRAVRQFRLDVVEGPEQGKHWISTGPRCTVGSHASCDCFLDDSTVSRFHGELALDESNVRIRDLGSRNGVYVDGLRVIEAFLRDGSTIQIGRSTLRFQRLSQRGRIQVSSRGQFGSLIGTSWIMRALFADLERVAATDAKVLLEGATGTGKSMAARSIHQESARRDGPFVMIDCGAIPGTLLESEFFGHVKGAFTGATDDRAGAFEEASGGTLFLDEIGELPLPLQPKLLSVLDTGTVRRVGSNTQHAVDVRIVAATNRDLRVEVNAGRFREDLYYRLAVMRLRLPDLGQRPEDLPALVRSLLTSLGSSPERIEAFMTGDLMATVRNGAWPGNVRQLRNYLEQCLVYDAIVPTEEDPSQQASQRFQIDATLAWSEVKAQVIVQAARIYFMELLRLHDGNVARAAAVAGVNRTYLYRLLDRHAIERQNVAPRPGTLSPRR